MFSANTASGMLFMEAGIKVLESAWIPLRPAIKKGFQGEADYLPVYCPSPVLLHSRIHML